MHVLDWWRTECVFINRCITEKILPPENEERDCGLNQCYMVWHLCGDLGTLDVLAPRFTGSFGTYVRCWSRCHQNYQIGTRANLLFKILKIKNKYGRVSFWVESLFQIMFEMCSKPFSLAFSLFRVLSSANIPQLFIQKSEH